MHGEKSGVFRARPNSKSLRTTIPTGVASHMGIENKDEILWTLDKVEGEWVCSVRLLKQNDPK